MFWAARALQRPLLLPQRAAAAEPVRPAQDVPARPDHVRRLLHPGHPHDPGPSQLRAQVRPQGLLRRRRAGPVRLQQQGAVRHGRGQRLRRPGQLPHLGRHPPHRGGLPLHCRRLAQGPLLQPSHPALIELAGPGD
uniref:Uncharacterized protein n=1 Tax=Zea mays TaxID=4577 RepID=C0P9X5_MAIZE|nr:unknown [Zea mays]